MALPKNPITSLVDGWNQAIGIVEHQNAALSWCLDQFHELRKAGMLPKDEELARGFHEIVESAHKTGKDYVNSMRQSGAYK